MKRKIISELDRNMVIGQIQRLDLERSYFVEITEQRKVRTIPQNKLYRLWLVCIAFETGNDADDLHEFFKSKYLEPTIKKVFDQEIKTYTTTNLNTIQFKNYLDHIQAFAARDLSITLPDPEDKYWNDFVEFYQNKM